MKAIITLTLSFTLLSTSVFTQDYPDFRISKSTAMYDLTGWTSFSGYKLSLGLHDETFGFYVSYEHGINENSQDFFRMKHESGDRDLDFDTILSARSRAHTVSLEGFYFFTDREEFVSVYSTSSMNMIFISSRKTKEANLELPFGYELARHRVNGLGITFGQGFGLNFRLHEKVSLFAEAQFTFSDPDLELDINASFNLNGGIVYTVF